MVVNITSLTGNGLKDWLIQRITAVVLGIYLVFMLTYFLTHHGLNYTEWYTFYHQTYFQIINVIMIVALLKHAWIGLWTVTTDYLKCAMVRVSVQMLILFSLLGSMVWFLMMIWG